MPVLMMFRGMLFSMPFAVLRMFFDLPVFRLMAVADNHLIMAVAVWAIFCPVHFMVQPGFALINHHFVSVVQVIMGILGRQFPGSDPSSPLVVYKNMCGHIVIGVNVR